MSEEDISPPRGCTIDGGHNLSIHLFIVLLILMVALALFRVWPRASVPGF
jgi:hypothetical protein